MESPCPRIVIAGAGFGGLYTALHLLRGLRRTRMRAQVTLLDRHNYFLFSPLLHEVAAAMVSPEHVVHPVRQFLYGQPVTFHEASVEQIDLDARVVHTAIGNFAYDHLVIALGSVTNYFGNPALAAVTFPMKTLGDASRLRNHLITMCEAAANTTDPDARRRLLTVVQVGAGFTGVEIITELHDLLHDSILKRYPSIRAAEITLHLVDALPDLPQPTAPRLRACVLDTLRRKGIQLHFNTLVQGAGRGWVTFASGERIETHTVIWAAGVMAHPIVSALPVAKGQGQRVLVDATLHLPNHPEVSVLGDCACVIGTDGKPLPMTAQVANQQAPVVADNLLAALRGAPARPFVFHKLGELASLGAYRAVADLGAVQVRGFFAWCLWRGVYLLKMPWWGGKFRIAADWTLDLLFPREAARIDITPSSFCAPGECSGEGQHAGEE